MGKQQMESVGGWVPSLGLWEELQGWFSKVFGISEPPKVREQNPESIGLKPNLKDNICFSLSDLFNLA